MKHSKYICLRRVCSFLLMMLFLFAGLATSPKRDVREREYEETQKRIEEIEKYVQKIKEENERKLLEEQNKNEHDHEE